MSLKLRGPDGHQKLVIHTDQLLRSGRIWKVVNATLDQRPCAAKILYLSYVNTTQLELACQIWRDLKHPNIVQFLGIVENPMNGTPIILMELMELSLTDYLGRSSTDITYHMQVNISHDIALAMDYLHRNGILHRDLTSNNILLNAHYQAKVTGFGDSAIVDSDPSLLRPMALVYMSPEAFLPEPRYSDKSDCFSVGILLLNIATRIFPNSTEFCTAASYEIDHRNSQIGKVPAFHGFLPVIRDCLKDKSEDRPSAAQLCQRLGQLKTTAAYRKSLTDPSFQVLNSLSY